MGTANHLGTAPLPSSALFTASRPKRQPQFPDSGIADHRDLTRFLPLTRTTSVTVSSTSKSRSIFGPIGLETSPLCSSTVSTPRPDAASWARLNKNDHFTASRISPSQVGRRLPFARQHRPAHWKTPDIGPREQALKCGFSMPLETLASAPWAALRSAGTSAPERWLGRVAGGGFGANSADSPGTPPRPHAQARGAPHALVAPDRRGPGRRADSMNQRATSAP